MLASILKKMSEIQKSSKVEVGFIFNLEKILATYKGNKTSVIIPRKDINRFAKETGQHVIIAHTHPYNYYDNYFPSTSDFGNFAWSYAMYCENNIADSLVISQSGYFSIKNFTFYCWDIDLFNYLEGKEKKIKDLMYKKEFPYTLKLCGRI